MSANCIATCIFASSRLTSSTTSPHPRLYVLDYSCGEALSPGRRGRLRTIDSGRTRARRARPADRPFRTNPKITVRSLDELQQQPNNSVDLAVINSVAQYMTPAELDETLMLMRRVLKPGGKLVLGDILEPDVGAPADVVALAQARSENGFLIDALWGLARTALSDYWQLRQSIGLQRYGEAEMIAKLKTAGFSAARAKANIGHNPARMTFVATPSG